MTTGIDGGDDSHPDTLRGVYAVRALESESRDPWVHAMCRPLVTRHKGPFVPLANGSLLTVSAEGISISHNDGATWTETILAAHGQDPREPASCYVLEPTPGTLVMVYLDLTSRRNKFAWDSQAGEPDGGCCCELHSIRSLDGGLTWVDHQCLLDGYNANFFGFIRTAKGRLVVVAEHLVTNPGRWIVCSFMSENNGQSWRRSNNIDLGGHGHHDGATEPTITELSDGRLLMLIRTNLGCFWQAFSDDGGRYWRTIGPSSIDASSSPGQLVRLESGRVVLVWNRRDPEGWVWPLSTPGEQYSEFPASWHREELSIAVTGDDAKTWSQPIVIARLKGGQLSYPHIVERRSGELWITAGFSSRRWFNEDPVALGMKILEQDLLSEIGKLQLITYRGTTGPTDLIR